MASMTRTIRILSLVAAAGGAAWLAKVAVIAASDDSFLEPVLYFLGVVLLCAGAASLTLRAARGTASRVAAVVAAPFLAILSYMLLDAIAKPIVGDAGPSWLQDEAGIALTGAVWLAIGLALTRLPAQAHAGRRLRSAQ